MLINIYFSEDDPRSLAFWSFAHMQDHLEIDQALLAQKGIQPFGVSLDPTPWGTDAGAWLLQHQQKHTIMDMALGVQSTDLTKFDFRRKEDRESFIGTNYTEHQYARQALGLSG